MRIVSAAAPGRSAVAAQLARDITERAPIRDASTTQAPSLAASLADRAIMETSPSPSSPPKLTAATRLTETGVVMGTPRFMSPEQIRGGVADHRSDQFSFCVALYHALYGAFPFAGEHPHELLDSIETGVHGSEHSAGLGLRLRKALYRGLSVSPSERFPSMGELLSALEPGLRRRRGWMAGAVLAALVAMLAAYTWPSPAMDPCARAGDGIAAAWSAERRAAVRAVFTRSDQPYAEAAWRSLAQRLDDYTNRWRTEAVAACRLTHVDHVQSEQQLDRRTLCLERGSRQVGALVSELAAGAPDVIPHAVEAADDALPDPRACNHTEDMMFGLEPPTAAHTHEVEAVRGRLARALVLEQLGRTEESLVIAREARVSAERLTYRPVQAETLVHIARALDTRQTAEAREEAQRLYFAALDIAEAERHDQLAATIWYRLVKLATWMDTSTQQAHAWWRRYEAAVHRIGNNAADQARVHHMRGEIYLREGKYAEAADEDNRAIAAVKDLADHKLELSQYYDSLAKSLALQGATEEAVRMHERALEIARATLGPGHPQVIKLQLNYGIAVRDQRQFERAGAVFEAALLSMSPKDRDSHLDAGRAHIYLSALRYDQGKLDDAAVHAREGLRIYKRAGAPEHRLAEAYASLGDIEIKRQNFQEALALLEQALVLRKNLGPDHRQVGVTEGAIAESLAGLSRYNDAMIHVREAERILLRPADVRFHGWILAVHGAVLVGQRQLSDAVPVLERALSLLDQSADPNNEALAKWALARALHGIGKSPDRVRQLAESASAQFAALGAAGARNHAAATGFLQQIAPATASPMPASVAR